MTNNKEWRLIGGYGELGDTNWGFDESLLETNKWLEECQKHIGEAVLLTGGGSLGKCWKAKLVDVFLKDWGKGGVKQVAVRLEDIVPKWSHIENVFEPWLGSWQISALFDKEEPKNQQA